MMSNSPEQAGELFSGVLVRLRQFVSWGVLVGYLLSGGTAWASQDTADERIAIIVNVDSPATQVSREELVNLFLGRVRQLDNGVHIVPLDQMEGSKTRVRFYDRVLDKSESQMNSYWSRLIFSGKGRPPYAVADDREVLELIAANRNMLGYVRASSVDAHVKVIQLVP